VIILDTNGVSEALKPAPSESVLRWLASQEPASIYITSITQAEILYGIELMAVGRRRQRLAHAAEGVFTEDFKDRILPFDEPSARDFAIILAGRKAAGRPMSQFDAMIAAIARSHGATVATRNTNDFEHCGIRLINPWDG
jgi:predicted nucleic acid-binding protein